MHYGWLRHYAFDAHFWVFTNVIRFKIHFSFFHSDFAIFTHNVDLSKYVRSWRWHVSKMVNICRNFLKTWSFWLSNSECLITRVSNEFKNCRTLESLACFDSPSVVVELPYDFSIRVYYLGLLKVEPLKYGLDLVHIDFKLFFYSYYFVPQFKNFFFRVKLSAFHHSRYIFMCRCLFQSFSSKNKATLSQNCDQVFWKLKNFDWLYQLIDIQFSYLCWIIEFLLPAKYLFHGAVSSGVYFCYSQWPPFVPWNGAVLWMLWVSHCQCLNLCQSKTKDSILLVEIDAVQVVVIESVF